MVTTLDIPDQALDAARRASPASLRTPEEVVLGSVVLTGLSGPAIRKRIRDRQREASREAEAVLRRDYSLRLPDASAGPQDLPSWIKANVERQAAVVEAVTREAVADVLKAAAYEGKTYELAVAILSEQFNRGVMRHLRRFLASFAVQGMALRWTSTNFRDGYGVAQPERRDRTWFVPVVRRRDSRNVGEVRFSNDGEVLTSVAELREQIDRAPAVA